MEGDRLDGSVVNGLVFVGCQPRWHESMGVSM